MYLFKCQDRRASDLLHFLIWNDNSYPLGRIARKGLSKKREW